MSLNDIDFTDLDNFADGFPHHLFAIHRCEAPVYWHKPTENTPDGEGFWSVATYSETLAVLRDADTYSSVTGGERPFGGTLLHDLPIAGQVLNMMDDPRHTHIRRLVSSGLTPRMIRRVEDDLRHRARALLDAVQPGVAFDFLVDVAAELPMQMICILLGVPETERHWLFQAIEPTFDARPRNVAPFSVPTLIAAIEAYLAAWNDAPRPFIWTATVGDIVVKLDRARQRLESIQPGCTLPRRRKTKKHATV